jgi:hypothetical protein
MNKSIPQGVRIADIVTALKKLNPAAAEMFVELYLGQLLKSDE